MNTERKTLAQITNEAIAILTQELGAADTIRFINQYTNGLGDYTEERDAWLGHLTLDEIFRSIKDSESGNIG